jgi:DNA-binding IclR family transcriptional regulator
MAARGAARLTIAADAAPPAESGAWAKSLALIECVAQAHGGATAAAVATASGLPVSTVHRLLGQLVATTVLVREPGSRRYRPGQRLVCLAWTILRHDHDDTRHAILARLVDAIGETCNFTMRDRDHVVYLDRVEAHWPLRVHLHPGSQVPLHCTASGKVFLAALPPRQRLRTLRSLPLGTGGPNAIASVAVLERELQRTRRNGVGVDNQEFLAGLIAVAVPVKDHAGRTVAAIAVHAPAARFPLRRAQACVPRLREAAAAIGATLPGSDQR